MATPVGWDQMHREHQAWLAAVRIFKSLEIDLNAEEALHAAIVLWGEELARLRIMQVVETPEVVERAYEERMKLFNQHIGFTSY